MVANQAILFVKINQQMLSKYNHVISLGYVCNVASYIAQENHRNTAYVFDRMGSPMWAVAELVENNFQDFLLRSNVKAVRIFEQSEKPYVIDSKYYLRLLLGADALEKDDTGYDNVVTATTRWKDRFLTQINNSAESILFIRSEEPKAYPDLGKRIEFPEYAEKNKYNELHYLRKFSKSIHKINPTLKFKILFLSTHGFMKDMEHNIIGIPLPQCDYRDPYISRKMVNSINIHNDYLNKNL